MKNSDIRSFHELVRAGLRGKPFKFSWDGGQTWEYALSWPNNLVDPPPDNPCWNAWRERHPDAAHVSVSFKPRDFASGRLVIRRVSPAEVAGKIWSRN